LADPPLWLTDRHMTDRQTDGQTDGW